MMPALQQVDSIEFLLLAAQLFLLVGAALASTQSLEDLAFAVGLMVFAGRLLAQEFELADVRLEFLAEAMQILPENGSELQFGGGAPGGERGRVGLSRAGEKALKLRQGFLGAGDLQVGLLQGERTLAFDALTEAEQRGENETEGHNFRGPYQAGSAMRRSRESFMTAASCEGCMRNSRSAGMSAMARSRSGSLPFW